MSVAHPTVTAGFQSRHSSEPFRIAVIIVPDRGLPVSRLKEFFHAPDDVAVVFVEHHSTDDPPELPPNALTDALRSLSPGKRIHVIAEGMRLDKNELYLLPWGSNFDIQDGQFVSSAAVPPESGNYLPDYFLSQLATAFGDRVTAVLGDYAGMLGAASVRNAGGLVFTATGPSNSPACNCLLPVDGVLSPGQFNSRLRPARIRLSDRKAGESPQSPSLLDLPTGKLLEEYVFPHVYSRRKGNQPIRIWVAGATNVKLGSLVAVRLAHYLEQNKLFNRVQVFATHFNRREVEEARVGLFSEAEFAGALPAELRQYFYPDSEGRYRVRQNVQQSCVFASHHLAADAPFSRCDLIICGDVVCHLSPADREKVLHSFHYALTPGASLFFLTSVNKVVQAAALFDPVANIPGLYHRREISDLPQMSASSPRPPSAAEREAEKILLSGYLPAAMLVDDRLQVIRFYGILSPFLRPMAERPSLQLLNLLRDELIFDVSDLLEKVEKTGEAAARGAVFLSEEEGPEYQLEVVPILTSGRNNKLIVVREKAPASVPDLAGVSPGDNVSKQRISALERQVQKIRFQLQSAHRMFRQTQTEMQLINEELTARNEDLLSTNEEFRSINEQLEARCRELESRMQEYGR